MEPKLNIKEDKFCLEYVKSGNGAKSAALAGYSAKTARITASKLLTKPNIAARVAYLKENIAETIGVSAVMLANELKKLAISNITDTRSSWMTLKDFKKLPEETKAAIAEISYESKVINKKKTAIVKIKMHSKIAAIDALNAMLGYKAPQKHELTGKNGQPIATITEHRVVFEDNSK